jgi:hypothetical protein
LLLIVTKKSRLIIFDARRLDAELDTSARICGSV